jgi:hypothetical protein
MSYSLSWIGCSGKAGVDLILGCCNYQIIIESKEHAVRLAHRLAQLAETGAQKRVLDVLWPFEYSSFHKCWRSALAKIDRRGTATTTMGGFFPHQGKVAIHVYGHHITLNHREYHPQ